MLKKHKNYFNLTVRKYFWVLVVTGIILVVVGILFWNKKQTTIVKVGSRHAKVVNCELMKISSLKLSCWTNQVESVMEDQGVDAAMDTVSNLADSDPGFLTSCHGMMHLVGQKAYQLFAEKKDFTISPKITYCSYGFYHGFMEELLSQTGDFQKAREFCSFVNNKLSQYKLDLSSQCYHGIGHGSVADNNGQFFGNAQGLASYALNLCKKVSENDNQLIQCASGVFNGLGNSFTDGSGGLIINKKDPLWLCKLQDELIRATCYGLMARVYLSANDDKFLAAISQSYNLTESSYKYNVISNIATLYISLKAPDIGEALVLCNSVSSKLRADCIGGFVVGYFQSGKPGKEYQQSFAFCSQIKNLKDKQNCYTTIFPYFKNNYSQGKLTDVCSLVEKGYQNLCLRS